MLAMALVIGAIPIASAAERAKDLPRDYFRFETEQLATSCLSTPESRAAWLTRVEERRRELLDMLGLWPLPARTDLRARLTRRQDLGDFEVECLHFQSSPGLYVSANLYLPKGLEQPAPAVLYVCGHGPAIQDGVSFGNKITYHHHGIWFARHGYVCLIIDTLQLGEIEGVHHGTYRLGQWWWNTRGYTPAGVETWNGIRALDYLQSRPEVDPTRIGMTGRSGGGAYTWFVAAVDERVRVAAPVAGITDLENHVVDGTVEGHCDCMFMVNTYRWDFPAVAALVAPRPLLIANSDKDSIFPLDGVIRLHQKVKAVYDLLGADANLGLLITEGPHQDTQDLQVPVLRWFNRFLKSDDALVERAAVKMLSPAQLKVFDELPSDSINARIQETFVPPAARANAPESAAEWSTMRADWLQGLREKVFAGWPETPDPLSVRKRWDELRRNLKWEVYEYVSQPGVELRILVVRGQKSRSTAIEFHVLGDAEWKPWVQGLRLLLGKASSLIRQLGFPDATITAEDDGQPNVEWFNTLQSRLVSGTSAVAWLAPRGVGHPDWSRENRDGIQIRRRFMLLGQTLDGMRVWDIRRGLAALRSIEPYQDCRVQIRAQGEMGVNALMTAVFEPALDGIEVTHIPASFGIGPDYLNILRIIDVPEAVAIAADRVRVRLIDAGTTDWSFPEAVSKMLGWERGRVLIE